MRNCMYISILVLTALSCLAMTAPKPAVVQGPQHWTADVQLKHLEQIMFKAGPDAKPKRFWYVILTVTNNTDDDIDFYPQCELLTDTFQIIPAGRDVPVEIFDFIKRRHTGIYPFLEALDTSGMRILQGEDNTKDIAIIWPDFDKAAKQVSLFIAGLSNETKVVEFSAEDKSAETIKVYLRKTMELDYTFSGDPKFRATPKITFQGQSWVMR